MPIYEYLCDKCKNKIEVIQKFGDAPLTTCSCGGNLTKLISKSSFHLKGTGWYITDYARKDNKGKSDSESTISESKSKSNVNDNNFKKK